MDGRIHWKVSIDLGEILNRIGIVKNKKLYSLKPDTFTTERDLQIMEMIAERKKEINRRLRV